MKATRRTFLQGLAAAVAAASLPFVHRATAPTAEAATAGAMAAVPAAGARTMQAAAWEQLGLATPVTRLFAPASGALFAGTGAELFRSDDAGATWRPVPVPAEPRVHAVTVDPTDHRVVYAATSAGLHRSDDEGGSWSLILPSALATLRVAVSPANPQVIYVAQGGGNAGAFAFARSVDGGATWETLEQTTQGPCAWSVAVLRPHPTDAGRLFRTHGCYAGRDLGDSLDQSRDGGSSFAPIFRPKTSFPLAIVGGGGVEPTRLYAASNNDYRSGGSLIATSADDGASWTTILEHSGGGTMTGSKEASTLMTGLAYDPAAPGRVFATIERKHINRQVVEAAGLTATDDGGQTWTELGQQDLPAVSEIMLGIDARWLFAATATGVWRMPLG